jgi:hypothetical protein
LVSTFGPLKPNSIEVSLDLAAGSTAGDEDCVTVNCANPGAPIPLTLRATQLPGVSTV